MGEHILDISDDGATLSVKHRNLVIARSGQSDTRLPLGEVAALVLAHPQIIVRGAASLAAAYGGQRKSLLIGEP